MPRNAIRHGLSTLMFMVVMSSVHTAHGGRPAAPAESEAQRLGHEFSQLQKEAAELARLKAQVESLSEELKADDVQIERLKAWIENAKQRYADGPSASYLQTINGEVEKYNSRASAWNQQAAKLRRWHATYMQRTNQLNQRAEQYNQNLAALKKSKGAAAAESDVASRGSNPRGRASGASQASSRGGGEFYMDENAPER